MHMAYDALVSAGVVAAGGIIMLTGWTRLDPLVSVAIAGVILVGTWSLLRYSVGMSLDAVPAWIKPDEVGDFLRQQPGVAAIHDLHQVDDLLGPNVKLPYGSKLADEDLPAAFANWSSVWRSFFAQSGSPLGLPPKSLRRSGVDRDRLPPVLWI
jgi:hypothetical protein